ncbi:MAG: hypothetical protein U0L36_07000 [Acutalibacteraceae bacterium]|nr:hypothetical protein [Acutalibacteraceae bacterium]
MNIKSITSSDEIWSRVRNYADNCSWKAGKLLANNMDNNVFKEWERVIVAVDNEKSVDTVRWQKQIVYQTYAIHPTLAIYSLTKNIEEID